jgi:hypothetical protein
MLAPPPCLASAVSDHSPKRQTKGVVCLTGSHASDLVYAVGRNSCHPVICLFFTFRPAPPACAYCLQPQAPDAGESVLDRFTNDLTQAARRNQLDPLVGRDAEMRRLTHILLRRTKNNPVLIAESDRQAAKGE